MVRPGEEVETAVVKLLDARGTLLELKVPHLRPAVIVSFGLAWVACSDQQ